MAFEYWSPVATGYNPVLCGSIDGTDTVAHDHGIIRALESHYRPNKGVIGDPACTLFVGRLNHQSSEDAVKALFTPYGPVRRIRLVRDVVTGFSKGYAFVEFYDEHTTRRACRDANGISLDDKMLLVETEAERTLPGWVPRRLGGGFGGRKESGQLRFGGRDRPFRKPIFVAPNPINDNQRLASHPQSILEFSEKFTRGQKRQFDERRSPASDSRSGSRSRAESRFRSQSVRDDNKDTSSTSRDNRSARSNRSRSRSRSPRHSRNHSRERFNDK